MNYQIPVLVLVLFLSRVQGFTLTTRVYTPSTSNINNINANINNNPASTPSNNYNQVNLNSLSPYYTTFLTTTSLQAHNNDNKEDSIDTQPKPRTLTIAEKARTIATLGCYGTLCSLITGTDKDKSTDPFCEEGYGGMPFGSYVDYVLDDEGCPVLLINDMSLHYRYVNGVEKDKEKIVSLFVSMPSSFTDAGFSSSSSSSSSSTQATAPKQLSKQSLPRLTLTGPINHLTSNNQGEQSYIRNIQEKYRRIHPYSAQVLDSPRFHLFKVAPTKIYYAGGYGVNAAFVDSGLYGGAGMDVVNSAADGIIYGLNKRAGHGGCSEDLVNVVNYVIGVGGSEDGVVVEDVNVSGVDRYGVDLRVTTKPTTDTNTSTKGVKTNIYRIQYKSPVHTVQDCKSEIEKIMQEGYEIKESLEGGKENEDREKFVLGLIARDSLGNR